MPRLKKDEGEETGPGGGGGRGGVANISMGERGWWEGMGLGAERGESRHVKLLAKSQGLS